MKPLLLAILMLFLISGLIAGCSSAKLTEGGKIKFSVPFDFPKSSEQELREKKILEEMQRLERQMDQGEEGFKASED